MRPVGGAQGFPAGRVIFSRACVPCMNGNGTCNGLVLLSRVTRDGARTAALGTRPVFRPRAQQMLLGF